ncbi:hypothetical protein [Streptomyces sp. NPDC001292]|uniref:hypothetical protein n=1 Tax=Streptomyces sp. NPDC001292 TaxID=3364558 RepID=UPI0036C9298B
MIWARRARRRGRRRALCWSIDPWAGPREWQWQLDGVLRGRPESLGASGRGPAGWDRAREEDPDHAVLSRTGFESAGRHGICEEHHWTIRELARYVRPASFPPPPVFAERGAEFHAVSPPRSAPRRPWRPRRKGLLRLRTGPQARPSVTAGKPRSQLTGGHARRSSPPVL